MGRCLLKPVLLHSYGGIMKVLLRVCALTACLAFALTACLALGDDDYDAYGAYEPSIDGHEDVAIRIVSVHFFAATGMALRQEKFWFSCLDGDLAEVKRNTPIGQMIHIICDTMKKVARREAEYRRMPIDYIIDSMVAENIEIIIGGHSYRIDDEDARKSLLDLEPELQTGRHHFYESSDLCDGVFVVRDGKIVVSVNKPRAAAEAAVPDAAAPADNSWLGWAKSWVPSYFGGQ